jgi:tRNA(Ile)-lysidine synthase
MGTVPFFTGISPMHSLETKLAAAWPPGAWDSVTVLVAVSGGADSVALLRAMAALKTGGEGRLVAVHVNHQLRGEEATADEAFVVDLCRRMELPCDVGRVRVGPAGAGRASGLEAAARRARYDFLAEAAGRLGARYVATAHTADDQAETILHRILRGTGIRGLAGMARARRLGPATLIRPLLGITRAELVAYLDAIGQPYRRDSSNRDVRFTRNRIRHKLLPQLARQYNCSVAEALLRLGSLAGEVQTVIDAVVEDLAERCVRAEGPDAVSIDTALLTGQSRYVVRELLLSIWRRQGWPMQAMGYRQWEQLSEMISAGGPRQVLPGEVQAERTVERLRLSASSGREPNLAGL